MIGVLRRIWTNLAGSRVQQCSFSQKLCEDNELIDSGEIFVSRFVLLVLSKPCSLYVDDIFVGVEDLFHQGQSTTCLDKNAER